MELRKETIAGAAQPRAAFAEFHILRTDGTGRVLSVSSIQRQGAQKYVYSLAELTYDSLQELIQL